MIAKKYSSGLVAESCWFIEFKEYLKLRKKDLSDEDIRKEIIDTNLFHVLVMKNKLCKCV